MIGEQSRQMAPRRLLLLLAAGAAAAFLISLAVGPSGLGIAASGEARLLILREIRLPRAVLGALIGGSLGLSGAVLQGYLRNPLADASLLGVSGGAALGAVLAIHLGLAELFALALPIGGLLGALVAMLGLAALAGLRAGPITLLLAGLAVSSIATALIALVLNLAQNPFAAVEMVLWIMGTLADRSLPHVWLSAPLMLAGMAVLLCVGRALDALTLGEDVAQSLGVSLERTRWAVITGTALSVGAATAVTGIIGFVGLIIPHALRPLVGHRPSLLLAASLLAGASMLLLADVALRAIEPWVEVRIGVLTALMGAPFFIWLVLKLRAELT
jgi:iron complex transport system permease protein